MGWRPIIIARLLHPALAGRPLLALIGVNALMLAL
jgi:hypothetical protein